MRLIGTTATGIRLPIISAGDDLVEIVTSHVLNVLKSQGNDLSKDDIVGVTEAMVAKMEGNFAKLSDIGCDVREKFGDQAEIGLVYPMLSRNRFLNILRGISLGAKKVHVLLSYPHDEVGNPCMDIELLDEANDKFRGRMVGAEEFRSVVGAYKLPYTGVDYVKLYEEAADNIEIHFSNDPRDILKLTKNVLVGEIHSRERTKARLLKAGAERVFTLSDILSKSVNGSGFNPQYGVLGSNLSSDDVLKLFPAKAAEFTAAVQARFRQAAGVAPEVIVYGDGAFKDPDHGIWELADPVVSPGFTPRLGERPVEIKMKLVADAVYGDLSGDEKRKAVTNMVKGKAANPDAYREGTTPRMYADLVGSLCDLMGGSGDKGTPVILLRGYFDDYSSD
ncbi:MAG: coenzyme F420-0:L-glutamate ligase [Defluviitaleaceae bacterium]|nr:coenzyme F420-0:L-glutamate ligase [Defluviitaleaceae bacterium]